VVLRWSKTVLEDTPYYLEIGLRPGSDGPSTRLQGFRPLWPVQEVKDESILPVDGRPKTFQSHLKVTKGEHTHIVSSSNAGRKINNTVLLHSKKASWSRNSLNRE